LVTKIIGYAVRKPTHEPELTAMTINENAQIDTSQARVGGGGGRGFGGIPFPGGAGGGVVGLIILALVLFGGIAGGTSLFGGDNGSGGTHLDCSASNAARDEVKCRDTLYTNSIENYWTTALPQSGGPAYTRAQIVYFDQAVNTGCGQADSGVGPFYCPEDDTVYLDTTFWNELATTFGDKGRFAQPYVLAHEYGHHIQDLDGTAATVDREMQRDPANKNALSVKLELQADCYAGVWAAHATETKDANGQPIFTAVTQQDITDAITTAGSVGDDTIQKKMGGSVDESGFTHGSSADREKWFQTGFSAGQKAACNTFGS
jgi:predicted metalloprotease